MFYCVLNEKNRRYISIYFFIQQIFVARHWAGHWCYDEELERRGLCLYVTSTQRERKINNKLPFFLYFRQYVVVSARTARVRCESNTCRSVQVRCDLTSLSRWSRNSHREWYSSGDMKDEYGLSRCGVGVRGCKRIPGKVNHVTNSSRRLLKTFLLKSEVISSTF